MRFTCPKCGGHDVSVEVKTWCRYNHGIPSFDDDDLDSVEVLHDGDRICHDCQHVWAPRQENQIHGAAHRLSANGMAGLQRLLGAEMKKQVEITQTLERYSSRFLAFRSRDAYRLQFPLGDFVVRQVPGALGMEWGVLQVTRREK